MYHYILWHHIFENFQIFQRAIELLQQLTKTTWQTTVEEKFYLPSNFTLMYGRSDGSTENLLNYLVKECDKKATEMLNEIEATR